MMDNEINSKFLKETIESLITRLCHDLINPVGCIKMAYENNEPEYLDQSIKNLLELLDIFRFLYREEIDENLQMQKIKALIEKNSLEIQILHNHKKIAGLFFYLIQKMLKKSSIVVKKDEIQLNYFFFNEDEIKALSNNFKCINNSNILIFLAKMQYSKHYQTNLIKLENNQWILKIQNI